MNNFLSELFWRMGRRLIVWSAALEPKRTYVPFQEPVLIEMALNPPPMTAARWEGRN